jgi:hypothetical protein
MSVGRDAEAIDERLRFVIDEEAEPADLRPLAKLLLSLAGQQPPEVGSPRRDCDDTGAEQPGHARYHHG